MMPIEVFLFSLSVGSAFHMTATDRQTYVFESVDPIDE